MFQILLLKEIKLLKKFFILIESTGLRLSKLRRRKSKQCRSPKIRTFLATLGKFKFLFFWVSRSESSDVIRSMERRFEPKRKQTDKMMFQISGKRNSKIFRLSFLHNLVPSPRPLGQTSPDKAWLARMNANWIYVPNITNEVCLAAACPWEKAKKS